MADHIPVLRIWNADKGKYVPVPAVKGDVTTNTNVTGLTYDVLDERYTGVTIGGRRGSLSTMLADMARR